MRDRHLIRILCVSRVILAGIAFVLRSLTPNHRDILISLGEKQVNEGNSEGARSFSLIYCCATLFVQVRQVTHLWKELNLIKE